MYIGFRVILGLYADNGMYETHQVSTGQRKRETKKKAVTERGDRPSVMNRKPKIRARGSHFTVRSFWGVRLAK